MNPDYAVPFVLGFSAIGGIPWAIWTSEVLDGAKIALTAKYNLDRIALGEEITLKNHWPINDARIDPYAGMFMKLIGGRKAIYDAVRKGRKVRRTLEDQ